MCPECGATEGHEQICTRWGAPSKEDVVALLPVGYDLLMVALKDGAGKYPPGHWRTLPVEDHLEHVAKHVAAHLRGCRQESHLAHAACRLAMAAALSKP
jgi:hypothetical protein